MFNWRRIKYYAKRNKKLTVVVCIAGVAALIGGYLYLKPEKYTLEDVEYLEEDMEDVQERIDDIVNELKK